MFFSTRTSCAMSRSTRRSARGAPPLHPREVIESTGNCQSVNHGEADRTYCVEYGVGRQSQYKNYFFCAPCAHAEDFFVQNNGKWPPNWSSSKYRCTATHKAGQPPSHRISKSTYNTIRPISEKIVTKKGPVKDITSPSTPQRKKIKRTPNHPQPGPNLPPPPPIGLCIDLDSPSPRRSPRIKRQFFDSVLEDNKLLNQQISACHEKNRHLTEDNNVLRRDLLAAKEEIRLLKKQVTKERKTVSFKKRKVDKLETQEMEMHKGWKSLDIENLVPKVLDFFINKFQKRTGFDRIGRAIANTVYDPKFQSGSPLKYLRKCANRDYKRNFYIAHDCAKACDLSGGVLNGSVFTAMRKIYTGGERTANCPLPSASSIQNAKKKVNNYAQNIIPFQHFTCNMQGYSF